MSPELDDQIHQQIQTLSKEGEELLKNKQYIEAIAAFVEALRLLPPPINHWEAATWLYSAIGDAYFDKGDHERALRALQNAMKSPGGIGNPFLHLRLGQVYYELGAEAKARDELMRAYMGDGARIFQGEDPKYFATIKDLI